MRRAYSEKGFSFVEVLIVIAVLGILASIGITSFTQVRQRSEDTRVKTDIEEIRSALEQYRSENNAYPTPNIAITMGLPFGTQPLTDETNTYMERIPQDPKHPVKGYYYTSDGSDYDLKAHLTFPEPTPCQLTPVSNQCGDGYDCNYCFGSYGKK